MTDDKKTDQRRDMPQSGETRYNGGSRGIIPNRDTKSPVQPPKTK